MKTGIVSYGTYIPRHRIDVQDIFKVWRNVTPEIFDKMSLKERAVLLPDEDSLSLAVAAAKQALERSGLNREQIGAVIFGSGTNPYATKAAATRCNEPIAPAVGSAFGRSEICARSSPLI